MLNQDKQDVQYDWPYQDTPVRGADFLTQYIIQPQTIPSYKTLSKGITTIPYKCPSRLPASSFIALSANGVSEGPLYIMKGAAQAHSPIRQHSKLMN